MTNENLESIEQIRKQAVFIATIKTLYPEKAIDLRESLELVLSVLGDIVDVSGKSVTEFLNERDFDKMAKATDFAKVGYEYEVTVSSLMNQLNMDALEELEPNSNTNKHSKLSESVNDMDLPDYDKYTVDNSVEQSLYDDFKHKRPHGFKLNNKQMVVVNSWIGVYIKLCELLCAIDSDKFKNLEHNPKFMGSRRKYISTDKSELSIPLKINDVTYIETEHGGANGIRNLMIKLLQEFDFDIKDFVVYYRADYTQLSNNRENK